MGQGDALATPENQLLLLGLDPSRSQRVKDLQRAPAGIAAVDDQSARGVGVQDYPRQPGHVALRPHQSISGLAHGLQWGMEGSG